MVFLCGLSYTLKPWNLQVKEATILQEVYVHHILITKGAATDGIYCISQQALHVIL